MQILKIGGTLYFEECAQPFRKLTVDLHASLLLYAVITVMSYHMTTLDLICLLKTFLTIVSEGK